MKSYKKRKKCFLIFLLFLFFAIFLTIYHFSNKLLIDIGISRYNGVLSTASYYAIEKSIEPLDDFSTFFNVEKNASGNVTMILTDFYKLNALSVSIANEVSNYFNNYFLEGVEVPIGAFTGIKMFAGFGKTVKMPLVTANSIKCDIVSSFTSAGINQTKHSLYINIIPEVYVVTRFYTKDLKDQISVLIYENIIVGEIPEVYLNGTVISNQKEV